MRGGVCQEFIEMWSALGGSSWERLPGLLNYVAALVSQN